MYSDVLVVKRQGSFERTLRLLKVFLLFIEETNFDQSVHLFLNREGAREDGVLEELARLINLIRLCEDCSELVQHFRLLVKVRGHLEDTDEGTYGVVVGLESLIEDADSVPQLGVVHVFYGV